MNGQKFGDVLLEGFDEKEDIASHNMKNNWTFQCDTLLKADVAGAKSSFDLK